MYELLLLVLDGNDPTRRRKRGDEKQERKNFRRSWGIGHKDRVNPRPILYSHPGTRGDAVGKKPACDKFP
jgi:hypothetical protein